MAAAPMPDPNSAAVQEAQRKQVAGSLARGGRASTILGTQGQNGPSGAPVATAAGPVYSGRALGSAGGSA